MFCNSALSRKWLSLGSHFRQHVSSRCTAICTIFAHSCPHLPYWKANSRPQRLYKVSQPPHFRRPSRYHHRQPGQRHAYATGKISRPSSIRILVLCSPRLRHQDKGRLRGVEENRFRLKNSDLVLRIQTSIKMSLLFCPSGCI